MALSANRSIQIRNSGNMMVSKAVIKTSVKVFKHALIVFGETAKKALIPANATTNHFLGLAQQEYTTSLATALVTGNFLFNMEARLPIYSTTSLSAGNVGDLVYIRGSDDKVTRQNTQAAACGRMMAIDGTSYAWVLLGHPSIGKAS